jgi:hypothetical protein
MANTYQLISKNTLASSTNTFTFSSIPQTFNNLVLKWSMRGTSGGWNGINMTFNGITTSTYSYHMLYASGNNSASFDPYIASSSATPNAYIYAGINSIPSQDTYLWNIGEMVIPNYNLTQGKQTFHYSMGERNTTEAYRGHGAGYANETAPISSITMVNNTSNWVANTTFYLYGISNA